MTSYQVISEQQDAPVLARSRHRQHDDCSYDGQDADGGDGQAFSLKTRGRPGGPDDDEELDGAKRDVEQDGLKIDESEIPDDETPKRRDASA